MPVIGLKVPGFELYQGAEGIADSQAKERAFVSIEGTHSKHFLS